MSPILCRSLRRRMALATICTVPLVWLLTARAGQTSGAPADLLIVNGRIYPADGTGHVFDAVAVAGGKVLRIGSTREMDDLRGASTNVIDARGRAVLPGFNDSHVHFLSGGLGLSQVDLAGLATLADVQSKIRSFAIEHDSASWVLGRGWLYSPFPGGLPTRAQLDAAVADRPAAMTCYDGHSLWVNSRALAAAGITKDTPDPKNGVIVRDPKTGEPTGVLKESAQSLVRRVLPQASRNDQLAAIRAAVAEALKLGLTSVQNASGTPEELEIFDQARRAGDLKVRYYSTLSIQPGFTPAEADRYDEVWRRYGDDPALKTGAVKIVLDGVIESRTAAMLDPYTNATSAGAPNYTRDDLERIVTMMDARGWQIWIHAIGDRAIRMALDAFEHAAASNPAPARGRRHRIEHIEAVAAADITRFGRLGVIASQQPIELVELAPLPFPPHPPVFGRVPLPLAMQQVKAPGAMLRVQPRDQFGGKRDQRLIGRQGFGIGVGEVAEQRERKVLLVIRQRSHFQRVDHLPHVRFRREDRRHRDNRPKLIRNSLPKLQFRQLSRRDDGGEYCVKEADGELADRNHRQQCHDRRHEP